MNYLKQPLCEIALTCSHMQSFINSLSQKFLFVPIKPISMFLLITFASFKSAIQWASANSEISKLTQTSKSDVGDVTMGKESF